MELFGFSFYSDFQTFGKSLFPKKKLYCSSKGESSVAIIKSTCTFSQKGKKKHKKARL